jgi:hypothetical protein
MDDSEQSHLDLTTRAEEKEASPGLSNVPLVPWDPGPDREKKRGHIANVLIYVLAGMVVLSFVYIFVELWIGKSEIDNLKAMLEILFAPIIGLVGAVTGFYFGEKK